VGKLDIEKSKEAERHDVRVDLIFAAEAEQKEGAPKSAKRKKAKKQNDTDLSVDLRCQLL
jgi:hypothetical protein